jgi:hypothetical protein
LGLVLRGNLAIGCAIEAVSQAAIGERPLITPSAAPPADGAVEVAGMSAQLLGDAPSDTKSQRLGRQAEGCGPLLAQPGDDAAGRSCVALRHQIIAVRDAIDAAPPPVRRVSQVQARTEVTAVPVIRVTERSVRVGVGRFARTLARHHTRRAPSPWRGHLMRARRWPALRKTAIWRALARVLARSVSGFMVSKHSRSAAPLPRPGAASDSSHRSIARHITRRSAGVRSFQHRRISWACLRRHSASRTASST